MKSQHSPIITSSGKAELRSRWASALAIVASFTAAGALLAASPGDTELCPACRETTQLTFEAEIAGANSELLLGRAKARTLPTTAERQAARNAAQGVFMESQLELRARKRARLAICRMLNECRYNPVIDPANFMTPAEIAANPNPYFPLIPGTLLRYQTTGPGVSEIAEFRVTRETRVILGVTCIEVRDTVFIGGVAIEDTRDWYAQDRDGNTWYFGELSVSFVNGQISGLEGSWEAGVDGAKPGFVMKVSPQVGEVYRQEYLIGEAEDSARIEALNESVTVPTGSYTNCRKIAEFFPFEPDSVEAPSNKFYAPNIGFVLQLKPGGEREELIAIEHF